MANQVDQKNTLGEQFGRGIVDYIEGVNQGVRQQGKELIPFTPFTRGQIESLPPYKAVDDITNQVSQFGSNIAKGIEQRGSEIRPETVPPEEQNLPSQDDIQKLQEAAFTGEQQTTIPESNLLSHGNFYQSALNRQKEALDKEAIAIQKANLNQANLLNKQYQDLETLNEAQQLREEERQKSINDDFNKVRDDISALQNMQVDPNRLWSTKSNFQKAMAAIGVALGAGAQVYGRLGSNPGLEIVNKAIDDDIRAQEQAIRTRGMALDASQNLLSFNRLRFQDERAADLATRMQKLAGWDIKLKETALRSKNPIVLAEYERTKGQLDERMALYNLELLKALGDKYSGALPPGASMEVKKIDNLFRTKAFSEGLRDKAIKELGDYQTAKSTLSDIDTLIDKIHDVGKFRGIQPFGKMAGPLDQSRAINTLGLQGFSLAKAVSGERLTDEDRDFFLDRITGGTWFTNQEQIELKKKMMRGMLLQKRNPTPIIENYGVVPPLSQTDEEALKFYKSARRDWNKGRKNPDKLE